MYFDQELVRVRIGNEMFPVKIDMYVLEKIQEEYGNIYNFELKIKGLVKTGEESKENRAAFKRIEPSISAMNFVLPIMVKEGCDIEGKNIDMTDEEIVRNINIHYMELNKIIVKEFDKCFKSGKK